MRRFSFSAFRRRRTADRETAPGAEAGAGPGLAPRAHGEAFRSAALLAIAALVPLLLLDSYGTYRNLQAERIQAEAKAIADARLLCTIMDQELSATVDAAQTLAASPLLDDPPDFATFRTVADRSLALHPLWLGVALFEPNGQKRVFRVPPGPSPPPPPPLVDPNSFTRVVRTHRPAIGDIKREPATWTVPVRAPVIRQGRLRYVLTIHIRPDRLQALIGELRAPKSWIVTVFNQDGHVVARSRQYAAFIGHHASPAATAARNRGGGGLYMGSNLEHTPTTSAYWKSSGTGWSVNIGIPRAELYGRLWRSATLMGLGLAGGLTLSVIFLLLFLRELEARRSREAALEQAARLEALGRLTGGVAHDFNNVLTVIQGNVAILKRKLQEPAAEPHLDAIRQAGDQAARRIRQLLVFARGGVPQAATVDVNETARTSVAAIRRLVASAGSAILVRTRFAEAPAWVDIDPIQLEAALLNLAANARDAMPGGGVLEISTRVERDFVELGVSDTGEGVPPEILSRVFEPFFTTKARDKGTGLGLSQVYGLARSAGGTAEIHSQVGRGTTVVLRLPLAKGRPAAAGPMLGPEASEGAGPRILLVDDDTAVRATIAAFLRNAAMTVREAADAAEALALLEVEAFDALVSDIVMPGERDGLGLARAARELRPGLPVFLISGFGPSASEAAGAGFTVLAKPIDLTDLERRLRAPHGLTGGAA